jgi:ATP-binding cassette subfamily B protein
VAIAVLGNIATALLLLAPMLIVQRAIDGPIAQKDLRGLFMLAGVFLAVQAALFALDAWCQYYVAKIGNRAMSAMRMELFARIQQQPMSFFHRNPVGRLVTRLTGDVNTLYDFFAQGIVGLFQQVFFLVAVLGLLFAVNWRLTLWLMPIAPAILFVSRRFGDNIRITYRITRVRLARLNTFLQESITGMKTVQAFGREALQMRRFSDLNALHRDAHLDTIFQYAVFFPAIEFLCALGYAIVIWRGGAQHTGTPVTATAAAGAVTVGQLALFVQALERFFGPVRELSEKYNLVLSAVAASDRLFRLLERVPEIQDPPAPVEPAPLSRAIEFKDVWFAYTAEDWVLRGLSFRVEKGQTVAVVGPTGAGKSTIMSLLCRFHDVQKGSIEIDGVDLRAMRQADLRRRIAIVLQDVFLFHGTVAGNIRLGNTEITDEQVRAAARAVNAEPFIEALPKGYGNGVKERGATLSVGQKQLLSFARALAFDPEILILDEATSNIDTETELLIQDALGRMLKGRTALVIAHRLSTVQRADRIIVMHHGRIVEEGTHKALLAKDGVYRRLYELQFKEQATGAA